MIVQLCNTGNPVSISREALADLDIFKMFRTFFIAKFPAEADNEIEAFLNTYLTSDAAEITRRSEIIGLLRETPESRGLFDLVIGEYGKLSGSLSALEHSPRKLMRYTQTLHALKAYIASIDHMERLFVPGDSLAMKQIAGYIKTQKESEFYASVQACLEKVEKIIQPLESVTLAVNMSETGQAAQIGVTDINVRNDSITGMFGKSNKKVNSLCDSMPVKQPSHKQRSQFYYLEGYIIGQVEKQWASSSNAALRVMNRIDINRLYEWSEWLKHIALFHISLSFLEKLLEKNGNDMRLCQPEPNAAGFTADDMMYPHMLLNALAPVPQKLHILAGDSVIVTGANRSGKTSVIKTIAQNCVLAQLGFWLPARSFKFMPFKKYMTVFAAGEDNRMRASRYQQEAAWMRAAIQAADSDTLLLFNEPFTSTNPVEASDLLCDIVTQLHGKRSTVVFVTHIYDVYDMLTRSGAEYVRSYVTGVRSNSDVVEYTYTLEERPPDGLSYARFHAREHGLSIDKIIDDSSAVKALEAFIINQL